ncbi:hypothetical protein [Lelliottia wanjuensis]|uniref:hypothetical protein n=1 Tax=Lelliottia wanjuensis TaxID=3050585 RepID=UPI00254E0634|nr:hypothetical protein [Lelliottia sp. V104_15]MDK9604607.1 hypothetical protein [Lelliottia sp. V104_15]
MKGKIAILAIFLASPIISNAADIPLLGNTKAQLHQLCGKALDVEIIKMDSKTTVMGLKNKQTNNFDLFMSSEQSPEQIIYSKFTPVKYDALSNNYIPTDDQDLDIIWGSSRDNSGKTSYSLTLGTKTYSCGILQPWPSERADEIYGESS